MEATDSRQGLEHAFSAGLKTDRHATGGPGSSVLPDLRLGPASLLRAGLGTQGLFRQPTLNPRSAQIIDDYIISWSLEASGAGVGVSCHVAAQGTSTESPPQEPRSLPPFPRYVFLAIPQASLSLGTEPVYSHSWGQPRHIP